MFNHPEKKSKWFSVEPDSKVFGIEPQPFFRTRDDFLEQGRLFSQDAAQLFVVENFLLVEVREFLAQWDCMLPLFVPLKVVDDFQVKLLLALPLFLTRISENKMRTVKGLS